MARARHLAPIFAFLLSLVAPAMTCVLPDARMTVEERACCREMKGHCASMGMPASHGCCRQSVASHSDAVQPHSSSIPAVAVAFILPVSAHFDLRARSFERVSEPWHSPPVSPPSAVSVLRI